MRNIEADGALIAIKIIVKTRGLGNEEGSRNSQKPESIREPSLKVLLYE
jgi:hypothetical protein